MKLVRSLLLGLAFATACVRGAAPIQATGPMAAEDIYGYLTPRAPWGITNGDVDMYLPANGLTFDYSDDGGTGAVAYRTANGKPYTRYVDKDHASATDVDNPHGSPSTPRRTWPYPLAAGECVQVHGGTSTPYDFNNSGSQMVFGGTGASDRPIFLYSINPTRETCPRISHTSSPFCWWGNWTIAEGLRFVNSTSSNLRPLLKGAPVNNVVIRHCYYTGTGVAGNQTCVSTGGSSSSSALYPATFLVVIDNEFSDYGDWDSPSQNDACSMIASEHSYFTWYGGNYQRRMGGDTLRFGPDNTATPSGAYYFCFRNDAGQNGENAIDIKDAINALIEQNTFAGFAGNAGDTAASAMAVHYKPRNVWIANNRVTDAGRGLSSTGIPNDHLWTHGNLIYNVRGRGLYLNSGGGMHHVHHNTVDIAETGILSTGTVSGFDAANNALTNITQGGSATGAGTSWRVDNSTVRAASDVRNELMYGSTVTITWSGTYSSVAAAIAGTTEFVGSVQATPLYTNAAAGTYTLQSASPARDAGFDTSETVYTVPFTPVVLNEGIWGLGTTISISGTKAQIFEQAFTVAAAGITATWADVDMNGVYRNQGAGYDIGAYEYDEGETPPADTTAPTPDPMTFSSAPAAVDSSSISMTASTATDATGPVEYYFDETTGAAGGSDSGWQSSASYTDMGLSPGTQYTYRVRARDAVQPTPNETAYSSTSSATTDDIVAPSDLAVEATTATVTTLNITP